MEKRRYTIGAIGLIIACMGGFFGCSDSNTGPDLVETIHTPTPADDAFSVPVTPVFSWQAIAGAEYFDLLLGLTRSTLAVVADSLVNAG